MTKKASRVLITGVAGFMGSHLAERLIQRGVEVMGLDNFSSGRAENIFSLRNSKGFTLIRGDILNERDLSNAKDIDTN
ncbi:MAG: hypothetical protein APU95_03100 [Hadesarchaea archaeon YNP_N21]|nr:MAG: hypothetical protein APU95_03100 [Hadesarchaea archaeon YNP_N21]